MPMARLRKSTRTRTVSTADARSEDTSRLEGPPPQLDLSDDVLLGHQAPRTAVGAVAAVVAHHEVVPLVDEARPPVVVAAVLGGHLIVLQRNVVHVDAAVHDPHAVAFLRDDALDE